MRNNFIHSALLLAALAAATPAVGQGQPQIINIPLSRPGEPMFLDISIMSARIEVIGEDRADAEFSVTVEQGSRSIITPSGSQPITIAAYSLEIDEEDNEISVDTDWRANKVSVVARIPRLADLELSTIDEGEIIALGIIQADIARDTDALVFGIGNYLE